jgi:CheY-like chemotaxis protein
MEMAGMAGDEGAAQAQAVLRILIIDDDPIVAKALRRWLRGHEVDVCCSGAEAIARCQTTDYDLIFCDVMMPFLSGAEVHQQLSRLRPEVVPRIVFVTGGTFTPQVTDFMAIVTNRVLEKPVDRKTLASVLASVVPLARRSG